MQPTVPADPRRRAPFGWPDGPPITSRADWGADESISPAAPEYKADVKAVFVHHTDGANDYSCADSASVVRSIYAHHVQIEGWKDIGYNFLADKCGTIFEGRKGGVGLPVLGAHTYGWNREAAGIAVLGDYTSTSASNSAPASIARLAAWKLGQYGAGLHVTGRPAPRTESGAQPKPLGVPGSDTRPAAPLMRTLRAESRLAKSYEVPN